MLRHFPSCSLQPPCSSRARALPQLVDGRALVVGGVLLEQPPAAPPGSQPGIGVVAQAARQPPQGVHQDTEEVALRPQVFIRRLNYLTSFAFTLLSSHKFILLTLISQVQRLPQRRREAHVGEGGQPLGSAGKEGSATRSLQTAWLW